MEPRSALMQCFAVVPTPRRIRQIAWHRIKKPYELRWHGLRLAVETDDSIYRSLFVNGSFEAAEFRYLGGVLQPGMTMVDCGANVGLYSIFAARKVGTAGSVVAIEASSREFSKLCKNVALNKLTNVELLNVAISESVGTLSLYVADEQNAGHNTSDPREFFWANSRLERNEDVPSEPLDRIVQRLGLQRIDFIKMDIENGELPALHGARETLARFKPTLLVEANDEEVMNLLRDIGYRSEKPDGFVNVLFHPS